MMMLSLLFLNFKVDTTLYLIATWTCYNAIEIQHVDMSMTNFLQI